MLIPNHRIVTFFIIMSMALLSPTLQAQMYKWVDDKGRTHYSESPPPKQYQSLEIKGEVINMTSEVPDIEFYQPPERIRKKSLPTLRKGQVWMFTTPTCGYCVRAKEYFRIKNISYRELDITTNEEYRHWFKEFGGSGVPLTLVGDRRSPTKLTGFSESRFDAVFDPDN